MRDLTYDEKEELSYCLFKEKRYLEGRIKAYEETLLSSDNEIIKAAREEFLEEKDLIESILKKINGRK